MSNTCYHTKKKIFESKRHAQDFISKQDVIHNKSGQLRYYPCEYCNGYHLTSKPKREEKQKPLKYLNEFKKYMK